MRWCAYCNASFDSSERQITIGADLLHERCEAPFRKRLADKASMTPRRLLHLPSIHERCADEWGTSSASVASGEGGGSQGGDDEVRLVHRGHQAWRLLRPRRWIHLSLLLPHGLREEQGETSYGSSSRGTRRRLSARPSRKSERPHIILNITCL